MRWSYGQRDRPDSGLDRGRSARSEPPILRARRNLARGARAPSGKCLGRVGVGLLPVCGATAPAHGVRIASDLLMRRAHLG